MVHITRHGYDDRIDRDKIVDDRFAATRHLSLTNFDDSGMAQAEPAARIVVTRAPPLGNEAGARRGS